VRVYLFFTQVALITFGGAYAVLGFVTEHLSGALGWLTSGQIVAGLALAESTPGPLVIVLQFFGFMAGWNQPGALSPGTAAVVCGLLAATATFLPAFAFIFMAAPYVEQLAHRVRLAAALRAITAVVVGTIANLAVTLALIVLWPVRGDPVPDWSAVTIALGAGLLLQFTRLPLVLVLVAGAAAGLLRTLA
jgi:chromate transporter